MRSLPSRRSQERWGVCSSARGAGTFVRSLDGELRSRLLSWAEAVRTWKRGGLCARAAWGPNGMEALGSGVEPNTAVGWTAVASTASGSGWWRGPGIPRGDVHPHARSL